MKTIYVIRHGQSRAQTGEEPWLDPALTEHGIRQAEQLRNAFTGRTFDHIRISPLQRARETFRLSGASGADVRFDSRLVECTLDRGPGFDYREALPYVTPPLAEPDRADMWNRPSGDRVRSLLDELRSLPGSEILMFGHCGLFAVLRWQIVGEPVEREPDFSGENRRFLIANTAMGVIRLGDSDAEDRLVAWNVETDFTNPEWAQTDRDEAFV